MKRNPHGPFFERKEEPEMKKTVMGIFLTVLVSAVLMAGPAMAQNASDIPWSTMEGQQTTTVPPKPNLPDTYGGSAVSYVMIPPSSFFPWDSTNPYTSNDFGRGQRWPTSGATDMVAPVHLPSGAKVIYLELDYYDNSASGRVYGSLTRCPWTGTGCDYHPTTSACREPGFICSSLAGASTGVGLVTANLTADNLVVDNYNNQFIALVEPTLQTDRRGWQGLSLGTSSRSARVLARRLSATSPRVVPTSSSWRRSTRRASRPDAAAATSAPTRLSPAARWPSSLRFGPRLAVELIPA